MPQNHPSQEKRQKKRAASSDPAVKSQEGEGFQTKVKKKMDSSKQEGEGDEESNPLEDPFEWMEWDWDPYDAIYVNTESNWEDARDDEETEDGVDEKFLSPRELVWRNRDRLIPHTKKDSLSPLKMEPSERAYYRGAWGFDPETHRLHLQGEDYRYDAWVPLDNDPEFGSLGIEMGARVDVVHHRGITEIPGTRIHTRIVFRRRDVEAAARCAHIVLEKAQAGNIMLGTNEWEEKSRETSTGNTTRQAMLPPWEHFAALKSYVAAIAEAGIGNMLRAAWMGDDMEEAVLNRTFGFNAAMQAQVLEALRAIAPGAAAAFWRDWMVELVEKVSIDWIEARQDILQEMIESAFAPVYDEANQEWNPIRGIEAAIQELRQHVPQEWVTEHQSQIKALFGPEQDFLLSSLWETGAEVAGQFHAMKEGKLDLSSRHVKSVKEIQFRGDLAQITELDVHNNALTSLAGLPAFPRLEKLDASSNHIKNLNDINLPWALKEIDLKANQITSVEIIGTFPKLERIDLSYNHITHLPNIKNCSLLKELKLANNQITSIDGFGDFTRLILLDLSSNQLHHIKEIRNLPVLCELKIGKNFIQRFEDIGNFPALQVLDLTDNRLEQLYDSSIQRYNNLQKLFLGGNPLKSLNGLQNFITLRVLSIGYTQITNLEQLSTLPNLEQLYLDGLNNIDLYSLRNLRMMRYISLDRARVMSLAPLIDLPNLQRIDLWETLVLNEDSLVKLSPIIHKKPF